MPNFKKGRKRKTNVLHKNNNLPSVTLFSKLNIEAEHINVVNGTKNYHITLVFLCSHQYLDEKVGTSRPKLSAILIPTIVATRVDTRFGIILLMPKLELRALDQPLC